jgi:hypothetical protein
MGSCTKGAELLSTSVEAALPQKAGEFGKGRTVVGVRVCVTTPLSKMSR